MEYVAEEAHVRPLYVDALQRERLAAGRRARARAARAPDLARPAARAAHAHREGRRRSAGRRRCSRSGRARRSSSTPSTATCSPATSRRRCRGSSSRWSVCSRGGSSALVAVSPEVRDDLVRLGVAPASRFAVVRLGLDLERRTEAPPGARERVRAELGVGEEQFLVAWLGRMTEIKRVDDLLRIFADLRSRGVDAVLVLVGDGPNRPQLERLGERARDRRPRPLHRLPHGRRLDLPRLRRGRADLRERGDARVADRGARGRLRRRHHRRRRRLGRRRRRRRAGDARAAGRPERLCRRAREAGALARAAARARRGGGAAT